VVASKLLWGKRQGSGLNSILRSTDPFSRQPLIPLISPQRTLSDILCVQRYQPNRPHIWCGNCSCSSSTSDLGCRTFPLYFSTTPTMDKLQSRTQAISGRAVVSSNQLQQWVLPITHFCHGMGRGWGRTQLNSEHKSEWLTQELESQFAIYFGGNSHAARSILGQYRRL